jgi:uncharacterized protein YebE (UPF0316 family)
MDTLYLCLTIFFARLIDVSLGTLRTVYTVKGKHIWASLIGIIEITVWFSVVKEALNVDNNSIFIVLSYALGFSVGTYLGGFLSKKLIKTKLTVQIITMKDYSKLIKDLRYHHFGVTVLNINSGITKKCMLFLEIDADRLDKLRSIIRNIDPKAFVVVNETKDVFNGYFGL